MKKALPLSLSVLVFLFLSLPETVEASHIMGVDIYYECTGPCTYRIYHKEYYDCTGGFMGPYIPYNTSPPPPPPSVGGAFADFQIVGSGTCNPPVPLGGFVFESYDEVTPICPALLNSPPGTPHPTGCFGNPNVNPNPPINGVVEAVYYIDYNFCGSTCTNFTILWDDCCRNNVITSGASGNGIFTGQTVINTSLTPCNNSPVFNNPPVPYLPAGQTFTFNQGAYDPDGDSLSYELGPCQTTTGTVGYDPGYSPQQPLGPTWNVQIDSLTGDLSITPAPTGSPVVGVICVVVKEWRDGVLINQIVRDMQITVIDFGDISSPLTGGVQNVSIGVDSVPALPLSFNEVRVCPGVEICFQVPVIPQDTGLSYFMTWNQNLPGAVFSDASNPTVPVDTVIGVLPTAQVCWTPPVGAVGAYYFVLTVIDDGCPIPGRNEYTIIIYVEDVLRFSDAVGTPIGCNEVELTALPVSTIPSPYNNVFPITNWTGNGNLEFNPNTQDSSFTHLYPSPNDYFFLLDLVDTFGCEITLPGIADLNTGVSADAGPDVTICSNFPFTLGTQALPGLTYTWTPNEALSDSSSAQPDFIYPNDSLTQTTFDYIVEVTDGICTTYDYTTVIVNPSLEAAAIAADSTICMGDSTVLSAIGNLGAGYTYLWSTGDTSANITVIPGSSTTYSVVTFNNGCSSDPAFVTVNVQTGPQAQISGDLRVCPGEATILTASGGENYIWSAGGWNQAAITIANNQNDSTISVIAFDDEGCPGLPSSVTLDPYPAPQPAFASDSVCEGSETSFLNLSSISEGAITGYAWNFNDGSAVVNQLTPSHNFTTPGIYDVSLVLTSDRGCVDSIQQAIIVHPTPEANFNFTNVCEGLTNGFTNISTIEPGGLMVNYQWDFGDDVGTGSGGSVNYLYETYGYYNVTLTVSTNEGCSDDVSKTVFVNPSPNADFEIISACEDSVVLASSASTVPGSLDFINDYAWDFGDDPADPTNTSTLLRPVHIYPVAGQYIVQHKVVTLNGCADSVTRTITVYPSPSASFTYDQTCENERTLFSNGSTTAPGSPIREWFWDFGNGATAFGPNPSYSYIGYGGAGTYAVSLGVKTEQGCVDTLTQDVIINPAPLPHFGATQVCFLDPDSTQFTDLSTIASGANIDWIWDFGDGSPTMAIRNPGHFYNAPGNYGATLTVISDSGCVNSVTQNFNVYELPEIQLIEGDSICFGDEAVLQAIAPPNVEISWFYSPEDEAPFHRGYAYTTPANPFSTTYYVQPTSMDQGCQNEKQPVEVTVYEDETLAIVSSDDVMELPNATFTFNTAQTVPIERWRWTFGDGNGSNVSAPVHSFEFPGRYEITVETQDVNGCVQVRNAVVEVKKIVGVSMPSAFSPNDDGVNDYYRAGMYNITSFQIQIFNRWGDLIYESNNPDFTWDGRTLNGNLAQEGVYVYKMFALDFDGNEINESRTITLIR